VTNARIAALHGLPVGPFSLSTTPVPLRKPHARHELHPLGWPHGRRLPSEVGVVAPAARLHSPRFARSDSACTPPTPDRSHKSQRSRRSRFRRRRLRNSPRQVEQTHLLQIAFGKSATESFGEIAGQTHDQFLAVVRPFRSGLLGFDNEPTHFPIRGRHQSVDRASGGVPRGIQQLDHAIQHALITRNLRFRARCCCPSSRWLLHIRRLRQQEFLGEPSPLSD